MGIFEVDLNKDFKIVDLIAFLNHQEFAKYYILNNLHDDKFDKEEFTKWIIPEHALSVESTSFLCQRGARSTMADIAELIKKDIYGVAKSGNTVTLYQEWQLFYIAIKKIKPLRSCENDLLKHLEAFKYIAEIRYKQYIVQNLQNFICLDELGKVDSAKISLNKILLEYIKNHYIKAEDLFEFLRFLSAFRRALQDAEKYKLMWNLGDTYILETMYSLMGMGYDTEKIYKSVDSGTYSELHKVCIYRPLYIKESSGHFEGFMPILSRLFDGASREAVMERLVLNPRYEDVIFTYIEANKIFNAHRINETVLGAMIRAMVLSVEEIIKEKINKQKLFENLKKLKPNSHLFCGLKSLIDEDASGNLFFEQFSNLINDESESLEKYLMIYYHARNYLAHNNIDMEQFFRSENGRKNITHNVINSVMVTLFCLAQTEAQGK